MYNQEQENISYSQFLSSLFSSVAIFGLSVLCILNNFSFDFYSMIFLFKIVIPASICSYYIGFMAGRILDTYQTKVEKKKKKSEKKAYEIPSMFSASAGESNDDMNDLFSTGE